MKQFFVDLWYGEPVRVFGIFAAFGTAVVAWTDLPMWADITIVGVQAISAWYGTRSLTTPEKVEKLSTFIDPEGGDIVDVNPEDLNLDIHP